MTLAVRISHFVALTLAGLFALCPLGASAHPHVWVTMTDEVLYAPDGSVTGVRHAWTFDDMFSTFATQGLDAKVKGQFTRDELKPLAEVNMTSLKEFGYFTYAKVNGTEVKNAFGDPVDYWLEYDPKKTELTLHFTLPLRDRIKAKVLDIEVYDPEFFVDFGFAEKDPVKLVNGPADCKLTTMKPYDASFSTSLRLNQSRWSEANVGMGINFANKIMVRCP